MRRRKKKLRTGLLAGLCLVLMLSGGCGNRGQIADTEKQGQTENSGAGTLGDKNRTGEKQGGENQQLDDWEGENGYYYNLEEREAEFVDYFLGEGTYEQEPYFSYVNPEGELQVELWYNADSNRWCGIRYEVTEFEGDGRYPYGFVIDGEENSKVVGEWDLEPVEEVLSVDDFIALNAADESIGDINENREYDDSGRLLSYKVTGDYIMYDWEKEEDVVRESEYFYSINYTYYDNGMTEKTYDHNIAYFGTLGHFSRIVYDERDREIYSRFFFSSFLSAEEYYLYEEDSDIPFGYLFIDEGTQGVPARMGFDMLAEEES